VIAVDVMRRFPLPETRIPEGGGWSGHRIRELVGPGIVSTLARSMVLGGWQRAEQNRRRADLVISPVVDDIGMFDFDRIDDAIEAGRVAADAALAAGLPSVAGPPLGTASG
jgi:predicted acylesterase/phospholipase RssA